MILSYNHFPSRLRILDTLGTVHYSRHSVWEGGPDGDSLAPGSGWSGLRHWAEGDWDYRTPATLPVCSGPTFQGRASLLIKECPSGNTTVCPGMPGPPLDHSTATAAIRTAGPPGTTMTWGGKPGTGGWASSPSPVWMDNLNL